MNECDRIMLRVFPTRTKWTPKDDMAFVGGPPLWRIPYKGLVRVSVTFSWDIDTGKKIQQEWEAAGYPTEIGGPAFNDRGGAFYPGRFIKEGVTITSRGCPKRCRYCLVHAREGGIRELPIQPGHIVQDNNLLACSRGHIEAVFDMLRRQRKGAEFKGGLDVDLLRPWHVDLLKSIRVNELWVACDRAEDLIRLDKARDLLADFSIAKKRCFVLVGYNGESVTEAERRLGAVYAKGFLPFVQPYKPPAVPFAWCAWQPQAQWLALIRKWSRPAAYRDRSVES